MHVANVTVLINLIVYANVKAFHYRKASFTEGDFLNASKEREKKIEERKQLRCTIQNNLGQKKFDIPIRFYFQSLSQKIILQHFDSFCVCLRV